MFGLILISLGCVLGADLKRCRRTTLLKAGSLSLSSYGLLVLLITRSQLFIEILSICSPLCLNQYKKIQSQPFIISSCFHQNVALYDEDIMEKRHCDSTIQYFSLLSFIGQCKGSVVFQLYQSLPKVNRSNLQ